MTQDARLVLVSNRGPATFERDEDGELRAMRGGGGLVTALTGLVNHRDALWIASAMTDEDAEKSREHGGGAFGGNGGGVSYRGRLGGSDPQAHHPVYNVRANPPPWFIQHYLWGLSNAPEY